MTPPDLTCEHRFDRGLLPSWNANSQYVSPEHREIWARTKDIPGWQEEGDSYKLYEMGYFAGDTILEIGTYAGRSAVCEILGALANPARRRVAWYGVDLDPAAIRRTRDTLMQWTLLHHCLLFHGNAEKFFAAFPIYPTMVFVDGDHRYEGVLRDTGILSRRLKKDTPVLFHDYTNAENDDGRLGVRKAVEEWVQAGRARFAGVCGCSALVVTTRDGEETQPESVVR